MYPELFRIGPIPVHTYGFLIAVGFICSMEVLRFLSIREKLNTEKVLEAGYWALLVGFLGARILFIITRFEEFSRYPLDMFKFWEGGLVFFGGPIAVIPFLIWYLRKNRIPMWPMLDISAIALTVGHAFGRLGCLAAGCCYGKPTGSSWGVKLYSNLVDRALQGVPLHPTQIYESVALFMLFGGLLWVHRRKKFDGQVALSYLMIYPIIRSGIETFRGDLIRGFVIDGILSTSQFISLVMFLGALAVLVMRLNQVNQKAS